MNWKAPRAATTTDSGSQPNRVSRRGGHLVIDGLSAQMHGGLPTSVLPTKPLSRSNDPTNTTGQQPTRYFIPVVCLAWCCEPTRGEPEARCALVGQSGDGWVGIEVGRGAGESGCAISRRGRRRGLHAKKFVAGLGRLRSLTPMAPHDRPPFDHHLERPETYAALDAASVEAVARRVVELLRDEGSSSVRGLVDAVTLAAELGVTRSWVYEHRAELGAVRLGAGSKPRLRFDVQRAREVLTGGNRQPSADFPTSTRAEGPPAHRRGGPRPADGPRRPGLILAVRPRGATRPPGARP